MLPLTVYRPFGQSEDLVNSEGSTEASPPKELLALLADSVVVQMKKAEDARLKDEEKTYFDMDEQSVQPVDLGFEQARRLV
jgi:hypothetical protein